MEKPILIENWSLIETKLQKFCMLRINNMFTSIAQDIITTELEYFIFNNVEKLEKMRLEKRL